MKTKVYKELPREAYEIRKVVFMDEQGFQNEFDEIDHQAKHIVLFDDVMPIATCRYFHGESEGEYIIGRIAVISSYRGRHIGEYLLKEAEKKIKKDGGTLILLHAQNRARVF